MNRLTMTQPIDPGITRVVAALQAHGFRTTDSGDGVSKADTIADGCAELDAIAADENEES